MWIRSQGRDLVVNCGAVGIAERMNHYAFSSTFEIHGILLNNPTEDHINLGEYHSYEQVLAVLDSIQARIDSGNTQTFQMPKAVSE